MKYFIDTNVFLDIAAHNNVDHLLQSKKFLSKIRDGEMSGVTGDIVLAEVVWVLGSFYKFPKDRINRTIKNIINIPNLEIVNNYDTRMAIHFYASTNIKYVDCVIASIPEVVVKEWTIVSYDEDFKKLPVLWKKPGKI